jgi:hypothetical protein
MEGREAWEAENNNKDLGEEVDEAMAESEAEADGKYPYYSLPLLFQAMGSLSCELFILVHLHLSVTWKEIRANP